MTMNRYFLPIVLLIFMLTSGVLVGCGHPPYYKASGEPVHLVNNDRAIDRPWREVWGFLAEDTTDREAYTPEHECGFFAEELHNRAEYYGLKTAFVVVEFETGEPHALNAFNTVDYGLVYVDCTGEGRFEAAPEGKSIALVPVSSWDKVAYIEEGEKIGFISLGYNEQNFKYNWYKKCSERYEQFEIDLDKFNEELGLFGPKCQAWILGNWRQSGLLYTDPCFLEDTEKAERLYVERKRLTTEWEQVRGYVWEESESLVKRIRIYW